MTDTRWIGPDDTLSVGDVGFLINFSNVIRGSERYEVRDTPAYTNVSNEPRLHGWCGTYNDLSTHACGMVRVERIAKNGRAFVRELEGEDLATALDELGYPELLTD
jgi:hypothetical protein